MKRSFSSFAVFVVAVSLLLLISQGLSWASQKKPINLRFATYHPPAANAVGIYKEWGKKLEEQTQGKVRVRVYPGGTLAKPGETVRAVEGGVCDIGFQVVSRETRFTLTRIVELPMMDWPSVEAANRIWNDLYAKFPEMNAEYKGLKLLWRYAANPNRLHLAKKEPRLPKDVKGLKIIAANPITAKAFKALGASPIVQPPPEWYMSLERGLAEGIVTGWATSYTNKFYPLIPFHNDILVSLVGFHILMNQDKWNSLPPDVQKAINDLNPWVVNKLITDNYNEEINIGRKACVKAGHSILTPTPEELKQWKDALKPEHEKWVADQESKGLPGKAIYEEALQLIKQHSK